MAQVLMLRRVILSRKKALMVLPFVSVVQEKTKHLRGILYAMNKELPRRERIKIRPFHGSKGGKFSGNAVTRKSLAPSPVNTKWWKRSNTIITYTPPYIIFRFVVTGRGHIAVCTIEKANAVVNRLMEDGQLDRLCCVVLDELHMINDRHRGYLLELLLR